MAFSSSLLELMLSLFVDDSLDKDDNDSFLIELESESSSFFLFPSSVAIISCSLGVYLIIISLNNF
jgi:hypothetical protein